MAWPERIIVDPEILAGKPVVRGTRLAVEFILELLAAGQSEDEILANYPGADAREHPRLPVLRELSRARAQSLPDSRLMKLLADENFPRPTIQCLRSRGHNILWARMDCPGLTDRALLAPQRPIPLKRCGVILFRVHPAVPETLEPLVDSALRAGHAWIGRLSIVTEDGIETIPAGPR